MRCRGAADRFASAATGIALREGRERSRRCLVSRIREKRLLIFACRQPLPWARWPRLPQSRRWQQSPPPKFSSRWFQSELFCAITHYCYNSHSLSLILQSYCPSVPLYSLAFFCVLPLLPHPVPQLLYLQPPSLPSDWLHAVKIVPPSISLRQPRNRWLAHPIAAWPCVGSEPKVAWIRPRWY